MKTRWGSISLVCIEEERSGVILPHEWTFSAHRDDRLKLMQACNAQFSQVFGLYEDPGKKLFGFVKEVIESPPEISFDFVDGTSHRMWIVQDKEIFKG